MRNGMTPLFTYDELEKWFDRFQSKAEDKMPAGAVHIKTKLAIFEALLDI